MVMKEKTDQFYHPACCKTTIILFLYPFFFPPVDSGRGLLVDGGVFSNIVIDEGILRCREQGFPDSRIVVDIIVCFDVVVHIDPWEHSDVNYKNAYDLYQRRVEYKDYYYYFEDIWRV